jgi:hypothetical protein
MIGMLAAMVTELARDDQPAEPINIVCAYG